MIDAAIQRLIESFPSLNSFIFGTPGDDTLQAFNEGDRVFGFAGDDILTSAFNDTYLFGGSGDDVLTTNVSILSEGLPILAQAEQHGGSGDDTMRVDLSAESDGGDATSRTLLTGGAGTNRMTANADASPVFFSDGQASNIIIGGGDRDIIEALAATTVEFGDATAENIIFAGSGDDQIDAVARNDGAPDRSVARNIIDGGDGNDTISALADGDFAGGVSTATNLVIGGSGDDTIDVRAVVESNLSDLASNTVDAGDGDDLVTASTFANSNSSSPVGINTLIGGDGNDTLDATHESFERANGIITFQNTLHGDAGLDTLIARIVAGAEFEASGANLLEGGDGDDTLEAEVVAEAASSAMATNTLRGGAGNDIMSATASAIADTGAVQQAENLLDGGDGDDVLEATIADGSTGSSTLLGGDGNDTLTVFGGNGNTLDGGAGDDTLRAGAGDDGLAGGTGVDTFIFDVTQDQGTDTLFDFERSQDRLAFNGLPDLGPPGLADDLDAITTVTDNGAGQDVIVQFDIGTTLVFEGLGTGAITSVADLVDDPDAQLIGERSGPVALLAATGPLEFNGSVADAQVLPHQDDYLLASGTLAFTFTADAVDGRRFLFSKDSRDFDDGGHLGIYIEDGTVVARLQSETETFTAITGDLIDVGTEVDLAVTFGAGGMKVFIDGQEEAANTYTGGLIGNEEPIVLGANQWSSGDLVADRLADPFDGTLSEFALFDTVLV